MIIIINIILICMFIINHDLYVYHYFIVMIIMIFILINIFIIMIMNKFNIILNNMIVLFY